MSDIFSWRRLDWLHDNNGKNCWWLTSFLCLIFATPFLYAAFIKEDTSRCATATPQNSGWQNPESCFDASKTDKIMWLVAYGSILSLSVLCFFAGLLAKRSSNSSSEENPLLAVPVTPRNNSPAADTAISVPARDQEMGSLTPPSP